MLYLNAEGTRQRCRYHEFKMARASFKDESRTRQPNEEVKCEMIEAVQQ